MPLTCTRQKGKKFDGSPLPPFPPLVCKKEGKDRKKGNDGAWYKVVGRNWMLSSKVKDMKANKPAAKAAKPKPAAKAPKPPMAKKMTKKQMKEACMKLDFEPYTTRPGPQYSAPGCEAQGLFSIEAG